MKKQLTNYYQSVELKNKYGIELKNEDGIFFNSKYIRFDKHYFINLAWRDYEKMGEASVYYSRFS